MLLKYDFQLLIPSLLIALADPDKSIRNAGIDCLKAMRATYAKCLGESKSAKKVQTQIFAYDEFYGDSSKEVQYLTANTAGNLVGALVEAKEELLTDPGFLDRYVEDLLLVKEGKKSGYKEDILSFLLTNILAFPIIAAQIKLLNMLNLVDSPLKVKTLYPLLERSLKRVAHRPSSPKPIEQDMALIAALLNCYTPKASINLFKIRNDRYIRAFCHLLDSGEPENKAVITNGLSVQRLAIRQIDRKWFANIPTDRQNEVFSSVIRLAYEGEQAVVQDAKNLLKILPVSWELVVAQCVSGQEVLSSTEERPTKKAKTAGGDVADALYRLTTVLEMLEYKEDIPGKQNLVAPLFDLLGHMLNAELSDISVSVEYVKQLILSVELSLFKDIKVRRGA